MRQSGRAPWFGLAIAMLICVVCSGSLLWLYGAANKIKESVVRISGNDTELKRSAKAAQGTLPKFISRLKKPQPGDRFAIRGRFATPVGPEYLWLKDPVLTKDGFKGVLDQKPIALAASKGETLHVKSADVYDWLVRRADGSMAGGFTEIALQREH